MTTKKFTAAGSWFSNMTVQVLIAIVLGVAVGCAWPGLAVHMKFFGDAFIRLVKLVVGPVVFLTVVSGITGVGQLGTVGRVGLKALVYFELVTTLALLIGLGAVNFVRPGVGLGPVASCRTTIAK
jgi:aerobic C4-dicarboxylate transport protein